jgi:hypothetical protein
MLKVSLLICIYKKIFLSKLDFAEGYHQVPSSLSHTKTAITTPFGMFEYFVCPSAPAWQQGPFNVNKQFLL